MNRPVAFIAFAALVAGTAMAEGGKALRGEVTEPLNGAVVSQLLPEQKEFFALPREKMLEPAQQHNED